MGRNISLSVPFSGLPPQEQDYLLATEALRGGFTRMGYALSGLRLFCGERGPKV